MKTLLTSSLLSIALLVPAYSSFAADASAPAMGQHRADWQAHRAEHVQARLDRFADLLQLTPAQRQGKAWQNYAKVCRDIGADMPMGMMHPPRDSDAATLARHRADVATRMATHLSALADATRELQAALTAPQRKALNELVAQEGPMMHHGMQHGFGPMHGDTTPPAAAPAGGE